VNETPPRKPLVALYGEARIAKLREQGLGEDLLPLSLTPEERQHAMTEPAPASPTGVPWLQPGHWTFTLAALLFAGAGAVAIGQPDLLPNTDWDQKVAGFLVAALAFISPGLRRK
jgi:hypothetical protein